MHIPAMDSLRHERVGLISTDDITMLVQAYVKTDDTDERGAYDPVEGMARPFPYMINAQNPSVVEPIIEAGQVTPLSDRLIEYISLLYESIMQEGWVSGLDTFDAEEFSEQEELLAASLLNFAGRERPQTLWRSVYKQANKMRNEDEIDPMSNPLRDIEGRERYNYEYLPSIDEVDEWKLTHGFSDKENQNGAHMVSESLWLRYKFGDVEEERPIVVYQNEAAGFTASSPSVEYGTGDMDKADESLIEAILSEEPDYESHLASVSPDELEGTRTSEFLQEY